MRWLGFAPLYDGLWISPYELTAPARARLARSPSARSRCSGDGRTRWTRSVSARPWTPGTSTRSAGSTRRSCAGGPRWCRGSAPSTAPRPCGRGPR
ncbi:hypothetical protein V2I01_33700 [Micromonospora sp. BRA006-A]|nr:hypothetical protein [Micromonospora sp. BRA006-A]